MKETAKKALKTGYGLGLLSIAQAKKVVGRVQKELDLDAEESMQLARALVKQSKNASEEVLRTVSKQFEQAVVKSGVAKKSELKVIRNVLTRRVKKMMRTAKNFSRRVRK